MNEENKELKDKSPEYKAGYTLGSALAYTIAGCSVAIIILIAVKIMQWIWLL
jgi:hypothetical protein